MPVFVPGQPIATAASRVKVEGELEPGRHIFQLVVVDDDGNESLPATTTVSVVEAGRPTLIIEPHLRGIVDPTRIGPPITPGVTRHFPGPDD